MGKVYVKGHYRIVSHAATPATVSTAAPLSAKQYAALKATLEATITDEAMRKAALAGFRVRTYTPGKPIPTKRADGDGGTCPYFGISQHWMREGVKSSNVDVEMGRCGFRRDGNFATANGYNAHLARVRKSVKS